MKKPSFCIFYFDASKSEPNSLSSNIPIFSFQFSDGCGTRKVIVPAQRWPIESGT